MKHASSSLLDPFSDVSVIIASNNIVIVDEYLSGFALDSSQFIRLFEC